MYPKVLILALLLVVHLSADQPNQITVNAKLPEDRLIHSAVKADGGCLVSAVFVSEKEIFSVTQGNWRHAIKLITYKLSEKLEGFTAGELSFICKDSYPVEGSRIKVKRARWPFKPGEIVFTLERASECKLAPFYSISAYKTAGLAPKS